MKSCDTVTPTSFKVTYLFVVGIVEGVSDEPISESEAHSSGPPPQSPIDSPVS